MASFSSIFSPLPILFLLSFLLLSPPSLAADNETHLHFFFHDTVSGPNATAVRVAQAPATSTSTTGFGSVMMIDDPLTEGPDLSSKLVGRAQGFYAMTSVDQPGNLLMNMVLAFMDGDFNGSTLAVLGHNAILDDVREMPIVGGSGKFRMALGYALAKTHTIDMAGNACVEYDVYVTHLPPNSTSTDLGPPTTSVTAGGAASLACRGVKDRDFIVLFLLSVIPVFILFF